MIKPAKGPILWYMKACGFAGWTSLWGTLYLVPEHINDPGLIRHEQKHLEQMARDGKLVFMVKYTWWLIRYGYRGPHPYEEEARKAQADATPV